MENKSIIIDPKKQFDYEYDFYKGIICEKDDIFIDEIFEDEEDEEDEEIDEQTLAERKVRDKNVLLFFLTIIAFFGIVFCLILVL